MSRVCGSVLLAVPPDGNALLGVDLDNGGPTCYTKFPVDRTSTCAGTHTPDTSRS